MIKCAKCGKDGVTAWQPHRCRPKALTIDGEEVTAGERIEIPLGPPNPQNGIYQVALAPTRRPPQTKEPLANVPGGVMSIAPGTVAGRPLPGKIIEHEAVPEAPHSSSRSPSRRKPRTVQAHTPAPKAIPSPEPSEIAAPDTPDTEPLIAPPGECPYCDRRRAAIAKSVRLHRERKITRDT